MRDRFHGFFILSAALGLVVLLISVIVLIPEDTPYRYGYAGVAWFWVQFASGVVLMWCGLHGCETRALIHFPLQPYNAARAWVLLSFSLLLLAVTLYLGFSDLFPLTYSVTRRDAFIRITALIFSSLALLTVCIAMISSWQLQRIRKNVWGLVTD
jgi:hypothetical protein